MIPGRRNTVDAPAPQYWCPFCIDRYYGTLGAMVSGAECWKSLAGTIAHAVSGTGRSHVVLPASRKGWTMADVAAEMERQREERRLAEYESIKADVQSAFAQRQAAADEEAQTRRVALAAP